MPTRARHERRNRTPARVTFVRATQEQPSEVFSHQAGKGIPFEQDRCGPKRSTFAMKADGSRRNVRALPRDLAPCGGVEKMVVSEPQCLRASAKIIGGYLKPMILGHSCITLTRYRALADRSAIPKHDGKGTSGSSHLWQRSRLDRLRLGLLSASATPRRRRRRH
jgi:hypothetical protein